MMLNTMHTIISPASFADVVKDKETAAEWDEYYIWTLSAYLIAIMPDNAKKLIKNRYANLSK